MENTQIKKQKATPEQLYEIFLECNNPQAPIKEILERHNLKPWELAGIRKRIKETALETLANPTRKGRKPKTVPVEEYQKNQRELQQAKDALTMIGYELALLKKKVN